MHAQLQDDLTKIVAWSKRWQLKIATEKCCALYLGYGNPKHSYRMSDFIIEESVNPVKDLGVFMSSKLEFTFHYNDITRRAYSRAMLISKSFASKNKLNMSRAFTVYVRPLLEYCSTVWNPYRKAHVSMIENVQRKFTRKVLGFRKIPYVERLGSLGLFSLELRRLQNDLCMMFQILSGKSVLEKADFFIPCENSTRAQNSMKCELTPFRLDIRGHDLSNRWICIWNNLSDDIIKSPNVSVFRRKLKKIDLKGYLLGGV